MNVVISMLRAVNLGGHRRVGMAQLRALYESLGFTEVQTCLQSGNVIFQTKEKDLVKLRTTIEKAVQREFGFAGDVILRTPADLRAVVAANPFSAHKDIEPGKLLVTFLAADPDPGASARISAIQAEAEELHLRGRELFIYFSNGAGRSKLTTAVIERTIKAPGTARNWNTVRKLLAMAEEIESGA